MVREAVKEVCCEFFSNDKSNEALFIQRMYSDGLDRYMKRLERIKFQNCKSVLDAGCGYGQWALALSLMNEQVIACDVDANRLKFLEKLIDKLCIRNIKLDLNGVDQKKYSKSYFDAIFCYSVLYKTEWRKSLDNILHSLKPSGHIYICSNGLGWYLYNYERQHNAAHDYNPRQYAIGSIQKTLDSHLGIKNSSRNKFDYIISSKKIVERLERECSIIYRGIEGGANLNHHITKSGPQPFFIGEFRGVEAVYEIIARRESII